MIACTALAAGEAQAPGSDASEYSSWAVLAEASVLQRVRLVGTPGNTGEVTYQQDVATRRCLRHDVQMSLTRELNWQI